MIERNYDMSVTKPGGEIVGAQHAAPLQGWSGDSPSRDPGRTRTMSDDLPSSWMWTTIGEITQSIQKVDPSSGPAHEFVYLDISSIDNTINRITEPKMYRGKDAPSRARQLVRAGDTLFSTVRTYLKNIAMVPEIYDGQIASTGFSVLRASPAIEPQYLFYYSLTSSFLDPLEALQRGTSYPAVRDDDVRVQAIPLAPLPEQRRIVAAIEEHFTRLDAAVASLKRAQANLRRYQAAVLKAACEGRLVPQDPSDEPASALLERIRAERRARWEEGQRAKGKNPRKTPYVGPEAPDATCQPERPAGWAWVGLDQLAWDASYGTSEKCGYDAAGPPVLRIPNISHGTIDLDDLKFATSGKDLNPREALAPGDLLIIRTNGSKDLIGRSAVVTSPFPSPHFFASYLIRYRITSALVASWLATIWDAGTIRDQITRMAATSAGQYNVSLSGLNELVLPLPPLAEQGRIVAEVEARLSVLQVLERSVEVNLRRMERLRQAILARAFAGQLVPQNPDDEPASVLLERVRAARQPKVVPGTPRPVRQLPLLLEARS